MTPEPLVLTLGHSTHPAASFAGLLAKHAALLVADVRSTPFSRFNPQFNRETLARSLAPQGIEYVFLGRELGARSEDPYCYDGDRVQYARLERTELFLSGIERVLREAAGRRVALMCAEKDPLNCHRALLVAPALVARGAAVAHIHPDGSLEPHAAALERLVDVLGLPRKDLFRSREEQVAAALAQQRERVAYVRPRS